MGLFPDTEPAEDPIEHLFAASTHDYLLFFTTRGKVYWQKVYDLPELKRDARGRAIVNLLNLAEGEKIAECLAIRDFDRKDHYLMMATRKGLVKKTPLEDYSRPRQGGIIGIKLEDGDALIDVALTRPGDDGFGADRRFDGWIAGRVGRRRAHRRVRRDSGRRRCGRCRRASGTRRERDGEHEQSGHDAGGAK